MKENFCLNIKYKTIYIFINFYKIRYIMIKKKVSFYDLPIKFIQSTFIYKIIDKYLLVSTKKMKNLKYIDIIPNVTYTLKKNYFMVKNFKFKNTLKKCRITSYIKKYNFKEYYNLKQKRIQFYFKYNKTSKYKMIEICFSSQSEESKLTVSYHEVIFNIHNIEGYEDIFMMLKSKYDICEINEDNNFVYKIDNYNAVFRD